MTAMRQPTELTVHQQSRLLEIDRKATDDMRDAVDAALSDPFPTFEVFAGSLAYSEVC